MKMSGPAATGPVEAGEWIYARVQRRDQDRWVHGAVVETSSTTGRVLVSAEQWSKAGEEEAEQPVVTVKWNSREMNCLIAEASVGCCSEVLRRLGHPRRCRTSQLVASCWCGESCTDCVSVRFERL